MPQDNLASLVVELKGENTIDVNTLINMLTHYMIITERANDIMGDGTYKAEVKVKALKEGSFDISLEVITTWLQNLLTKENITYASNVVAGIASAFTLFKYFKGRDVSKEEARQVINIDNSKHQHAEKIINIYNDPIVQERLIKSFETAKSDIAINGIRLIANGEPSELINESEFGELTILEKNDPKTIKSIDKSARLSIVSLSFDKGDNWKFIYKGNKITTKLSDDGLQKAIDMGASFAKGDALDVELEITQKWDEEYNAYVNHKYKVMNVIDHIKSPKQQTIFDDNYKQEE